MSLGARVEPRGRGIRRGCAGSERDDRYDRSQRLTSSERDHGHPQRGATAHPHSYR